MGGTNKTKFVKDGFNFFPHPPSKKMAVTFDALVKFFPIVFILYAIIYLFVAEAGCVDGLFNALQDVLVASTGLGTKLIG